MFGLLKYNWHSGKQAFLMSLWQVLILMVAVLIIRQHWMFAFSQISILLNAGLVLVLGEDTTANKWYQYEATLPVLKTHIVFVRCVVEILFIIVGILINIILYIMCLTFVKSLDISNIFFFGNLMLGVGIASSIGFASLLSFYVPDISGTTFVYLLLPFMIIFAVFYSFARIYNISFFDVFLTGKYIQASFFVMICCFGLFVIFYQITKHSYQRKEF